MFRRLAAASAGGVLAVTSYAVLIAVPASAGAPILPNTVKVTKVVEGDSKGAGFQVEVTCEPKDNNVDNVGAEVNGGSSETLTFGPQGGTEEAKAPPNSTCTIIETHDGGASKVVVDPSTCDFTNEIKFDSASEIIIEPIEGETCEVTVTNTFEPPQAGPAGPAGPPGPPGEAAAAQAVVTTARFTG
jgi:Domain of unknown function (DUF5979)